MWRSGKRARMARACRSPAGPNQGHRTAQAGHFGHYVVGDCVATRWSKGVAYQLWLERQAGGSPRSPQRAGGDSSAFRRGRRAPLDEPTPPVPPSNSVIALKINNLRDMSRPLLTNALRREAV